MNTRIENWYGRDIRFVEVNSEWCAVLRDIELALSVFSGVDYRNGDLKDIRNVQRVKIDDKWELVINELGIYELLLSSDVLEARNFKRWTGSVLRRLRDKVGLEPYEVLRMTDPEVQKEVDSILDTLFYNEETGKLMMSVTVAGGDVEQEELDF